MGRKKILLKRFFSKIDKALGNKKSGAGKYANKKERGGDR